MLRKNFNKIAKEVIELEIKSLKKLKSNINKPFNKAVEAILNCKNGKVIISGVGKSGIIGKKISSTLSSVGTPSFFVDAGSCSHGDLGQISSNDVLILISNSGQTEELKPLIQFAARHKKIILIGIMSKKNSLLYKSSDIKLLMPEVTEAGPGNFVPTSSSIVTLSLGHALSIATMKYKKFSKLDFKRLHNGGYLGQKLRTVEDLMLTGNKIPIAEENILMKKALQIISRKRLGVLVVKNNKGFTTGIVTDGDVKRASEKIDNLKKILVKKIMKKNPISVEKNMLAAQALSIMNAKKITSLLVHQKNKKKTIGIIHIHNILNANIQ